jgi:Flp pilus assembly protein CpaB
MRLRRFRRRPTGWFAVAGVLAILAFVVTMRAAATRTETEAVLVARANLHVGTRLDQGETPVELVRVPVGGVLPGMVRDIEQVRGRTLAVPVAAGEPLTEAVFGGSPELDPVPLRRGERAVSVPLTAAGAAAAVLVPGVRVDVVAPPAEGTTDARLVVSAAEVLAQRTPPGAEPGTLDGAAVLLRVSDQDALRLSAALDLSGGVRLLPRPVGPNGEVAP